MALASIYLKEEHVKRGRGTLVTVVCVKGVGGGGGGGLQAAFP